MTNLELIKAMEDVYTLLNNPRPFVALATCSLDAAIKKALLDLEEQGQIESDAANWEEMHEKA